MSHAIVEVETVLNAMLVADNVHTPALQLCIDGASDAIERWANRRFLTDTFSAWHDGSRAAKHQTTNCGAIYLADPQTGFATLPVTAITSISEDGVALQVIQMHQVTAFNDGESVVVVPERGIALRASVSSGEITYTGWATGNANVKAVYTAGYSLETMPQALQLVCIDLTQRVYRESFRLGMTSQTELGMSVSYERLLPPWAKEMLASFKFTGSPRTLAG